MNIEFNCSECGQLLAIDSKYAGAKVECPKCKAEGQVPEAKPVSKPVEPEKGTDISEEEKPRLVQQDETEKVARGARRCPQCGEIVSNRAIVCKGCGGRLEAQQEKKKGKEGSQNKIPLAVKTIFVPVFIVFAIFVILFIRGFRRGPIEEKKIREIRSAIYRDLCTLQGTYHQTVEIGNDRYRIEWVLAEVYLTYYPFSHEQIQNVTDAAARRIIDVLKSYNIDPRKDKFGVRVYGCASAKSVTGEPESHQFGYTRYDLSEDRLLYKIEMRRITNLPAHLRRALHRREGEKESAHYK